MNVPRKLIQMLIDQELVSKNQSLKNQIFWIRNFFHQLINFFNNSSIFFINRSIFSSIDQFLHRLINVFIDWPILLVIDQFFHWSIDFLSIMIDFPDFYTSFTRLISKEMGSEVVLFCFISFKFVIVFLLIIGWFFELSFQHQS